MSNHATNSRLEDCNTPCHIPLGERIIGSSVLFSFLTFSAVNMIVIVIVSSVIKTFSSQVAPYLTDLLLDCCGSAIPWTQTSRILVDFA